MNSLSLSLLLEEIKRLQPIYNSVLLSLQDGIALYGYGFVGKWAFDFLRSLGADIQFIIDNDKNKQGTLVNDIPIVNSTKANYEHVNSVVIGSRHAAQSISSTLNHLSVPIISIDAFVVCHYSTTHLDRLEKLLKDDDKSLQVLYSILLSMLTGNNLFLRNHISFTPFFAEYPFYNVDAEVYLDAGAYVGDSFERFIWSVNGMFKFAYLFEPGKHQYESMLNRLKQSVMNGASLRKK